MGFIINTDIEIDAPAERVFEILTDFGSYQEWNPFISKIEGEVKEGNIIHVSIGKMSFTPEVLSLIDNKQLYWKGKYLANFIFSGEHRFELTPGGEAKCSLKHYEIFKGILLPMMKKKLLNETTQGFEAMNIALKNRAEVH